MIIFLFQFDINAVDGCRRLTYIEERIIKIGTFCYFSQSQTIHFKDV